MAVVDSTPPVTKRRRIVRKAIIAHSSETERLEILRQKNIAAVRRMVHIIETTLAQRQKWLEYLRKAGK